MAETPGRLQVEYFDGSNWVALTSNGNSLVLELEIIDTLYNPQTATFKIADLKNNGIFAASSTNSVLKEFMNIRILDADKYIIYFSGKIFRMAKTYEVPYGEVIEAVCYDPLYSLGNEYLDTDSDSIAATKAHTLISTWIGNHISTSLLSVTNDSGDVDRFETSSVNRANTSSPVKAGRSQISVLAAILQEALQDIKLTALDRGYIYYVDPNFTSTATSHNPAGFFNYFARNRMPAQEAGTSGDAVPLTNGLTIEKPAGVSISETGTKHIMMSRLDLSTSNRELVTDIIANYYHDETGKRVSKRFSIIHYTALSGMASAQYDGIGFDVTPGTGGSDISNLVDSGNNVIGRIQYMSVVSGGTFPGFMILSDRTDHALVAGETLYADSSSSGITITLSSVATIGSQNVYEPKAVWGVSKTMKSNFDKESNADEIRTKLAAIFEGRQNVPDRLSFTTSQLPYYWAEGRATSSTTGATLHDSAVNWELKGVRTGATFLKLSGTGGTVSAYGYVSSLTDAGVITCTLNTGSWAVNDYYRWQVRVRAGHQVHIKCVPKGISGENQIVTKVSIRQNMGSQTLTSWETQGAAARSIPTDLAESTTSAASHSRVDTGSSPPVPIGDVPAKLTSAFTIGAKSSPDGTRHNTLSWAAGTLKFNKSLTIDGNETDEYTINNNDTTTINGGALSDDTEYMLYFKPDDDLNDFKIVASTSWQSEDRTKIKVATIKTVSANGASGDGLEAELSFDTNDSSVILEGAASGAAGSAMRLGGDYFAVDGILAKHMLTVGSDGTSGVRFKLSTPASAANAAWFRGFTADSNSDTTGKWFEFDVANKALNFFDGGRGSAGDIGYIHTKLDESGITFYDVSAATAASSNKLVEVTSTGINIKQTSAGIPSLRFGNTNISAGNEGAIGLRSVGTANTPMVFSAPADINDSTAFSFEVENASYGSGTTASNGTLKLSFGHTLYTDAQLWLINGREGSDFTIRHNLADSDSSGATDPGNLILDNFKSVVVEDGTAALPSVTFDGSDSGHTGIFLHESGASEYLGIAADGVISAYFGEDGSGIWFYEHVNAVNDITQTLGTASYRWRDVYCLPSSTTTGTDLIVTTGGLFAKKSSSIQYKDNVKALDFDSSKLDNLRPVSYTYKFDDAPDIGLIAEEVNEVYPELVNYNEEGKPESVKYDGLSVMLLDEVKALRQEIKELKEKN
jgi:hypothetical protein